MKCPKCGKADSFLDVNDMYEMLGQVNKSKYRWMCSSCDHMFTGEEIDRVAWYRDADFSKMKINELADVIYESWGSNVNFAAKPYLDAMASLEKVDDMYGNDSASEILQYFLINARQWRGETARAVKKEIKDRLKCQNTLFSYLRGM